MEIIYRVCEHSSLEHFGKYKILNQDVMLVNSKEDFKEAIKLLYGEDVKFKHTTKMTDGDIFISIVSYDCYNAEKYVCVKEYKCSHCGKIFKTNEYLLNKNQGYDLYVLEGICKSLYSEQEEALKNEIYCSRYCKDKRIEELKINYKLYVEKNNLLEDNSWVTRDDFKTFHKGYIYMITKKSTGEFYVGQTNAVPMFRWVQHLKTERFTINHIEDYKYEILEKVEKDMDMNQREAYWINKKRDECPEKSLNIVVPKVKYENLKLDLE